MAAGVMATPSAPARSGCGSTTIARSPADRPSTGAACRCDTAAVAPGRPRRLARRSWPAGRMTLALRFWCSSSRLPRAPRGAVDG